MEALFSSDMSLCKRKYEKVFDLIKTLGLLKLYLRSILVANIKKKMLKRCVDSKLSYS